ncbi:MAG: hypothetical protein ACLFU6_09745 [Candidatus Hydrogenedentota bacterium]
MSDVTHQIVRCFLELRGFRIWTHWHSGDGPRFYVDNPNPAPSAVDKGFLFYPLDMPSVERAAVAVRAWHGERLYPSVIEANPGLAAAFSDEMLALADEYFQGQPYLKLLIVSEFPVSRPPRARVIELLRESPVDHVMEYPALLQDLLNRVDVNLAYTGSPMLQTLRILKRYHFIRNQQLEFAFPHDPDAAPLPHIDTTSTSDNAPEEGDGTEDA